MSNQFNRFTLVIPRALDDNLNLYAIKSGRTKSKIIIDVMAEFLRKQGWNPDKTPEFEVKWGN